MSRRKFLTILLLLNIAFVAYADQDSKSTEDAKEVSGHASSKQDSKSKQSKAQRTNISKSAVTKASRFGDLVKKWDKDPEVQDLVEDAKEFADSSIGFWHAFVASISVIIVSELGDKTFFIAAIMAMRYSRFTVFMGAISALGLMTVLSACLGFATQIIPRAFTFYASTVLFAFFGLKMLREGYYMSPNEGQEEFEEAQEEIRKREDELERKYQPVTDLESGIVRPSSMSLVFKFVSKIYLEAFTLTFLAEWGDRSQITTIILAARENVLGVTLGGTIGHALCTGFAVLGGRLIAQRISVRTVTLVGGVVFILFALSALFITPEAEI